MSVRRAAEIAGVSIAMIRRAYRSGRLRATRPAGTRRIVIRVEDLREWAIGDDQLVATPARAVARPRLGHDSAGARTPGTRRPSSAVDPGSRESLREIEREYEEQQRRRRPSR